MDYHRLTAILSSSLPADVVNAIAVSLEVAALHLPHSPAAIALANHTRDTLAAGSDDPRPLVHSWHVDRLGMMLAQMPQDHPMRAVTMREHSLSLDLLAKAIVLYPPIGTKTQ